VASYTEAQYEELIDAIASGVLSTGHGDKRVQYRSLEEMIKLAAIMRDDIDGTSQRAKTFSRSRYNPRWT
jgi:hypothetical protein